MSKPVFRRKVVEVQVEPSLTKSQLLREQYRAGRTGGDSYASESDFTLKPKKFGVAWGAAAAKADTRSVFKATDDKDSFEPLEWLSTPMPSASFVTDKGQTLDMYDTLGHRTMRRRDVKWTAGCTEHAVIQLGPTCHPSTLLNLVLTCDVLRNHCIRFINRLFADNPGMQRVWSSRYSLKTDAAIGFHMHILHGLYRRMCTSELPKRPGDPSFAPACALEDMLRENFFETETTVSEFIDRIGLSDYVQVEIVKEREAPSSRFSLWKTPFQAALDKHRRDVLLACVIYFFGRVPEERGDTLFDAFADFNLPHTPGYSAHAVLGVVCADGSRRIVDPNFGDVDIDWKRPDFPKLFTTFIVATYGFTDIQIERDLVFCTKEFERHQKRLGPAKCM